MTIEHIFVVGAGTMGNGIAQVAATSGYRVTCMDVMPAALEKAKAVIQNLPPNCSKKKRSPPSKKPLQTKSTLRQICPPSAKRTSSSKRPPKTPN